MGRTVKDPNRRQPKPEQKVQLSEKNVGRRIVLVVLFLAIGSGFLVYGFMNFLLIIFCWAVGAVVCMSCYLTIKQTAP